jgi:ParB family chromosome partitioning protein
LANVPRGLGRGLSSLIPDNEYGSTASETVLPLDKIIPNKDQPRRIFEQEKIRELADSIGQYGVLQPLIVVAEENAGTYRIVAGERRYRASIMAGLKEVPVIVKQLNESEILQIALIENLQREDINDMEAAQAYRQLNERFGYTQEQIAEKIGKSRAAVTNTMRLLALPEDVQKAIAEKRLTPGHARAVLALKDESKRSAFADYIVKNNLTVRQAEKLSETFGSQPAPKGPAHVAKPPHIMQIEDDMRAALGTKVTLFPKKNKGTIEIEYYSGEDLERLIDLFHSLSE